MCCVSHCKDTKLKAIHNKHWGSVITFTVVFHTAKIQNWKQFTTGFFDHVSSICCVSHCKDTKLKAIHNSVLSGMAEKRVVFHTAKIQNWKQFTTATLPLFLFFCCVSHCKDTKLKAIHNFPTSLISMSALCFTLQRYKIESNSQLWKKCVMLLVLLLNQIC